MDAVANHIWQSTIVGAAAAGVLAWMLRNNSASVRYWIWFAAAMKFLVPFAALTAVANRTPAAAVAARRERRARGGDSGVPLVDDPSDSRHRIDVRHRHLAARARSSFSLRWAWQWQRLAADARQSPPGPTALCTTRSGARARGRHQQPHGDCGVKSLDRAWRARHPDACVDLAAGISPQD